MNDDAPTEEASPHSRVEAAAPSGSTRTASLRAKSKTERLLIGTAAVDGGDESWWPQADVPGSVSHPAGPQGIAESTGKQSTAFTTVPTFVARQLYAAAPPLTPPDPAPSSAQPSSGPAAPSAAAPASQFARTGGHVQFSNTLDAVPGEIPPTPGGRRAAEFLEKLGGRSFATAQPGGLPPGLQPLPVPTSPERTSRLAASSTMRRYLSGTRQALQSSASRQGPNGHWELLERRQDVEQLQLEITLQHATSIEKVSASDLMPFSVQVAPFVNGGAPSPAVISAVRGVPELRRGAFYVPSELTDAAASGSREVVSGVLIRSPREQPVMVQLFVLFPSLMRPPRWLRTDFTMVKRAVVEVDWQLPRRTQFLLYCVRRLEAARRQSLAVWASRKRFGVGEAFTLFGAEGRAELTDRSYVLLIQFYKRMEGPGPRSVFNMTRDGLLRPPGSAGGTATPLGGEIDLGPPSAVGAGAGGGLNDTFQGGLLGVGGVSFGPGTLLKGCTKLEALQEVQQQLLLRAQSSDVSGQFQIPESGLITWDGVLDYVLAARDGAALRRLIESHYLDHLLRTQEVVDRVEKVAFANNDPALMMIMYDHTSVEMDLRVLAFLVHCWAVQPLSRRAVAAAAMAPFDANDELPDFFDGADPEGNLAARIEEFLVKYVINRRNPLSSTAAILRAIDDEMAQHEENRRMMRLASSRFHSFHLALLRRLNRYSDIRNLRLVERILQPAEMPNTVNEVSAMQVAFESGDLKFMTETLIELYVKVQWLGRELMALTSQEDLRSLGATNPLLAYAVLKTMGFAGKGTMDPLAMAASRLWHLYVFTSNAFFDSPRGRWAMHVLFELVFLGLYQWQVMFPDMDMRLLRVVHLVFLAFILGNLLDMAQFVHYRYGSLARIRRFMTDPWNALGLLVNIFLLGLSAAKLAQDFGAGGFSPYIPGDPLHVCMATLAVFVWVRALGMAVPVYPSLGPLLNTVARMVEEVIAFLFPMVIVMTGFSTMMTAVFQDLIPGTFGNFFASMLQLFSSMLGNFDFAITSKENCDKCSDAINLYGTVVQVIFLVISAILLMNLLIAIITNRYRPQEVEAESQFKKAQIVSYYQTQVTRNLVCSPFCLPQLVLQALPVLPSGRRDKLSGSARGVMVLGLVPLDGVVLPDDGSDRPTGASEIPHLVFLLTLYPIMAVTCVVLYVLYTPFGVIQFASKLYVRSVKRYGKRMEQRKRNAEKRSKAEAKQRERQAAVDEAFKRASEQQLPQSSPAPTHKRTPSGDVEAGGAADADGAAASSSAKVPRSPSGGVDVVKQYQKLKKALQADAHQAEVGVLHTVGYIAAASVLTVVGVFFYVAVLLVLMLVGWSSLYQWLAKVLFSLHNVLVRPFRDMLRTRRRRQQISPMPAAPTAAAALHAASGAGAEAATGGMSGCGGTPGGGGSGPFKSLFSRNRVCRDGRATSAIAVAAAAAVASNGGGGGSADSSAGGGTVGEEDAYRQYRRNKARLHWRHAIQRVLAMKNERYLSKRDVLKALAASKFKPHMMSWDLRVDLRSSSQDIMESQMQDLEDDNDPWDDDELQAIGEDDDTLETTILDRTEKLTGMLRTGITEQAAAMAAMNQRIMELSEELAALRASGGAAAGSAAAPPFRMAPASPALPPAAAARPAPPPPSRPPSVWGLAAELGRRVGVEEQEDDHGGLEDGDDVLFGSGVRQEPELNRPVGSPALTWSRDTKQRPSAADDVAVQAGDQAGDGAAAACAVPTEPTEPTAEPTAPPPPPSDSTSTRPTRTTRAKTAPPRPSQAGSPSAGSAGAAVVESPAPPPPPPGRAFAESIPNATATAAATTTTTTPPGAGASSASPPPPLRPPLPPASHSITPTASGASHGASGSPAVSTHGSARRSSSAGVGAGSRPLVQQRTLDRLLNASGGAADAILAAVGTEREGGRAAGHAAAPTAAAARSSFSRPVLEPIRSGGQGQGLGLGLGQAPPAASSPAVAGTPAAAATPAPAPAAVAAAPAPAAPPPQQNN